MTTFFSFLFRLAVLFSLLKKNYISPEFCPVPVISCFSFEPCQLSVFCCCSFVALFCMDFRTTFLGAGGCGFGTASSFSLFFPADSVILPFIRNPTFSPRAVFTWWVSGWAGGLGGIYRPSQGGGWVGCVWCMGYIGGCVGVWV